MLNDEKLLQRGMQTLNDIDGEQGAKVMQALAAQGGCEKQLAVHIHAALNVGLSREEIVETFIHCVPYLGFPKVLNAVFTAKEVFAEG